MSIFKQPDGYSKNVQVQGKDESPTPTPDQIDPSFCAVFETREEYIEWLNSIKKTYLAKYEPPKNN